VSSRSKTDPEAGIGDRGPSPPIANRRHALVRRSAGGLLVLTAVLLVWWQSARIIDSTDPEPALPPIPSGRPSTDQAATPPPTPEGTEPHPASPERSAEPLVVAGRVLVDGDPVPRARVLCRDSDGAGLAGAFGISTDRDGAFSIPVDSAVFPIRLEAVKSGYESAALELGAPQNDVVMQLGRGRSISGVLVDEDGNPVRSSVIALRLDESGRIVPRKGTGPGLWSRCDVHGQFEITGVPPGRYRVEHSGVNHLHVEGSSTVCSAGDSGLELVVHRACALDLHLVDRTSKSAAQGRFAVHLTDRSANTRSIDSTSPRVVIRGLRAGEYTLRVSSPRYETFHRSRLILDRPGRSHPFEITLTRRGEWGVGQIQVHLAWPSETPGGAERPELRLRLVPRKPDTDAQSNWPPRDSVPEDGIVLSRIPVGEYRIYAWTEDFRWVTRQKIVDVRDGETVSVSIRLVRAGEVRPRFSPSGEMPDLSGLTMVLTDERGIRLSVAWLDRLPATTDVVGLLPAGRVTVKLLSGESVVAAGDGVVRPGEKTEVFLR